MNEEQKKLVLKTCEKIADVFQELEPWDSGVAHMTIASVTLGLCRSSSNPWVSWDIIKSAVDRNLQKDQSDQKTSDQMADSATDNDFKA